MKQGANVVVDANRVHHDQRHFPEGQRVAKCTGPLAFSILQVEQLLLTHALEITAEVGIDFAEYIARILDQAVDVVERLQRLPARGVDPRVPESQPLPSP